MSATTCSSVKKRKIPMQKRETKEQRAVTFSKRRTGLFNKAAELCVLCNTQVVILVSAPLAKEKFYTFAHPNINLLLDTFLNNHVSHPINNYNNLSTSSSHQTMEQLTPNNNVSKTKKRKRESEEFWWENEDFDVYQTPEEVTSIIEKLEKVRENVALKLQKLSTSNNQDINSSDHQNYHLGCFAEDIMNINNEYSKESGDQSQFMTSVVFQNLSTSTYHGSCIDQNIVDIDGFKNNVDFMQMLPLKSTMLTHNTNNGSQDIENYHNDMGTTFEAPLFFSNGVENYQDISSGDHQNYHLGCFAENIMNINHEYNNESGDQSQFMPSVVFQNLSTSTYQDGCIDQNMVNVDGNKNNVAFMQMLPLNSTMFTHNTNNDTQDIENYHYDMGTTFEPPLFFSNGVENYQDISNDHQNYHLGCFAENIMNIDHEYNDESGDQSQFMSSVVFQNLSTSTYHGSCIDQNIVDIDGFKNNVDFMQMLPLKSTMLTHNTNNGSQDIQNYHNDMVVIIKTIILGALPKI
ncbi:serum factor response D-like [Carica papaya]|uniref:serum factor response D-like n=1 Tax=Carica papaya TaxID=3649 RepID=UPI000B8CAD2B|nr:serum factor response D-like [Carica papaya]